MVARQARTQQRACALELVNGHPMSQETTPSERRYIFVAQVTMPASHHAIFEELYENEHVPNLMKVPGVKSCSRFKMEWAICEMAEYLTIYEVDHPDVPKSEAWREAANKGGWGEKVRPFYTLRQHGMYSSTGPTVLSESTRPTTT